jgi:hypothetical protein
MIGWDPEANNAEASGRSGPPVNGRSRPQEHRCPGQGSIAPCVIKIGALGPKEGRLVALGFRAQVFLEDPGPVSKRASINPKGKTEAGTRLPFQILFPG